MPLPTNFLGMDNDDVGPVPKRSRRVMLGAKTAIKRLLLEKQPVNLEALCGGIDVNELYHVPLYCRTLFKNLVTDGLISGSCKTILRAKFTVVDRAALTELVTSKLNRHCRILVWYTQPRPKPTTT